MFSLNSIPSSSAAASSSSHLMKMTIGITWQCHCNSLTKLQPRFFQVFILISRCSPMLLGASPRSVITCTLFLSILLAP